MLIPDLQRIARQYVGEDYAYVEQVLLLLKEFQKVGELITKLVKGLSENLEDNSKIEEEVRNEVIELTSSFPIYKNLK